MRGRRDIVDLLTTLYATAQLADGWLRTGRGDATCITMPNESELPTFL